MYTNYLGLTRNHLWSPNRLTTQRYSTKDRCDHVLGRSIIFGYVRLAYNTDSVLLLTEIKEDLKFEINSIRNSSIREEGVYESSNDGIEVSPEYIQDVLSICDMLIGETKSALTVDLEAYVKNNFHRSIVEYYNMVYSKVEGEVTVKSINNVYIRTLKRSGMGIYTVSQSPENFNSLVTLDSSKIKEGSSPNILDFMSCFTFMNANSDNYLCWLACMCIEPDENMMTSYNIPLGFVNKWFSPNSIDQTINVLSTGNNITIESTFNGNMTFVCDFLLRLRERQDIKLGQVTNMVLKSALTGRNYIDKSIIYVLEVLTAKKVVSNDESEITGIDQEYIDAFKSSDLYREEFDITSEFFIDQIAAEDDPAEGEDPVEEEDPTDDPEEDPAEDEEPEEDDPLEEEGDDTDTEDPEEGEESSEPTNVSKTNDSKGTEISVQEGECTLDEYLYRKEVGFILSKLLENPPEKMSAEKIAILRDIKTRWLYIFDVKTIHNTLSKIIDLKIKVKTEQVA